MSTSSYAPPLATLLSCSLCVVIHVSVLVFDLSSFHYTLSPRLIIYLFPPGDLFRLLTSPYFHGSIMHLGMNMMSTAYLSTVLEKKFGTLPTLHLILALTLLVSSLHTFISFLAYCNPLYSTQKFMLEHSLGYSGVIFTFAILETSTSRVQSRSIYGLFEVPTQLYPWVLLILIQVLMPNISFLGHLSGILVGTLIVNGVLDKSIFPSPDFFRYIEEETRLVPTRVKNHELYVKVPDNFRGISKENEDATNSLFALIVKASSFALKFVRNIVEAVLVITGLGGGGSSPSAPRSTEMTARNAALAAERRALMSDENT
ncbi:hypothetical protein TrST_g6232 [Triparma strigata]|uniref:Peptidase S54 rhomboid domain-containing protein n=1 Tax=Triparma strigata TaxID=1606541 RepID=A0A9W7BGE7_9STRA|nr:hypothetical protein TrST_g6232 [Triparma strigata]